MDEHRPFFPIAVPSSSGMGGVAPRVIILQDELADDAHAVELAVSRLIALPVSEAGDVAEAFQRSVQDVGRSADLVFHEMSLSAQSMNSALVETVRASFEDTLSHWQNLANAAGPSDAYELQLTYLGRQVGLVLSQAQALNLAFQKMLHHPS